MEMLVEKFRSAPVLMLNVKSKVESNSCVSSFLRFEANFFSEYVVVLLGESGVGKSSLTHKFVTGYFRDDLVSTIGASFLTKTIHVKQPTKFNIWDTAGQEKYRALAALYYRGVDCAIIVYDITDRVRFVS